MSKRTGVTLVLLTATGLAGAGAQTRPERTLPPVTAAGTSVGVFVGGGVEHLMRLRSELKLKDAQYRQLNEIRGQQVQREQEMIEMRSRMAAGQLDREEARAQIDERRM